MTMVDPSHIEQFNLDLYIAVESIRREITVVVDLRRKTTRLLHISD